MDTQNDKMQTDRQTKGIKCPRTDETRKLNKFEKAILIDHNMRKNYLKSLVLSNLSALPRREHWGTWSGHKVLLGDIFRNKS